MLLPYILTRPFWHPNSQASFPLAPHQDGMPQVESLTQKLDIAEKKNNEYAQLIASLSAEVKEYQNIICRACKEKVFRAGLDKTSLPKSTASASTISACIAVASMSAHNEPSGVRQLAGIRSPDSHGKNSVIVTSQPERVRFDYSVEYNPEINRVLNVHVANTFEFLNRVYCAKFSRDGKYLAVGLEDGETHIYDMMTGSKSVLVEGSTIFASSETAEMPVDIWGVRFSPDNKFITTGGSKGQVTIWEIGRRRIRAIFKHLDLVRAVDLSPDGRFIASASYDKSVCLWRVRDGAKGRRWYGSANFMSVGFSLDGRYVAAGNDHGVLSIWDVRTGRLVVKCKIGGGGIATLRSTIFTPDGDRIASGGSTVQCWDVSSLRHGITDELTSQLDQLWEFKGHQDFITAVSLSPESRWAVSSSYDRDVCMLDARTGYWVCTLKGHLQRVLVTDFSPAGRYLISGGRDRLLRLWRYDLV